MFLKINCSSSSEFLDKSQPTLLYYLLKFSEVRKSVLLRLINQQHVWGSWMIPVSDMDKIFQGTEGKFSVRSEIDLANKYYKARIRSW